ncbi:MAG: hypothetical protein JWM98_3339 [Thermoleophilia bacterium]|nr:hypothetical protein [Thermoleophilia bacterium]
MPTQGGGATAVPSPALNGSNAGTTSQLDAQKAAQGTAVAGQAGAGVAALGGGGTGDIAGVLKNLTDVIQQLVSLLGASGGGPTTPPMKAPGGPAEPPMKAPGGPTPPMKVGGGGGCDAPPPAIGGGGGTTPPAPPAAPTGTPGTPPVTGSMPGMAM